MSNLNHKSAMRTVATASERTCAGYWFGFDASNLNQDPIKVASFYKESRTT